jgi:serine/threonine protein kinase
VDIIDRKIGRYNIAAHIGEGGMALVYSAFNPEIDRTVVLKILKTEGK